MEIEFLFQIAILILSVVVHEVAHGYAAYSLGDPTAHYEGRLTLNPVKHLDFTGSILIPTISYLLGGFIIGWAKPVPYNPYNLRNGKWGETIVAAAGPISNLLIALCFGLLLRFGIPGGFLPESFVEIAGLVVLINILLAVFNLVPVPPLDGSKILFSALPVRMRSIRLFLERNALILILVFVFFLWRLILPVVGVVFELITGMSAW